MTTQTDIAARRKAKEDYIARQLNTFYYFGQKNEFSPGCCMFLKRQSGEKMTMVDVLKDAAAVINNRSHRGQIQQNEKHVWLYVYEWMMKGSKIEPNVPLPYPIPDKILIEDFFPEESGKSGTKTEPM
jgi:hypothetical protein